MRSVRAAVMIVGIVALSGCDELRPVSAPRDGGARVAEASVAREAPLTSSTAPDYIAVVVPARSADVAPASTGVLVSVLVRPGDLVVAGQPLAVVDARSVHEDLAIGAAELRREHAAVERARIDAQEAVARVDELQRLVGAGHASTSELASARFASRRAKAIVSQSEAAVAETRGRIARSGRQLDETSIVAPFSGRVAARYLDAGAIASPSDPVVRVNGDQLWLRIAVPQEDAPRIEHGATLRARLESTAEVRQATVWNKAPALDAASRMVFLEAELGAGGDPPWPAGAAVWIERPDFTAVRE
jgi:RND family efflux transporter MFP subunit